MATLSGFNGWQSCTCKMALYHYGTITMYNILAVPQLQLQFVSHNGPKFWYVQLGEDDPYAYKMKYEILRQKFIYNYSKVWFIDTFCFFVVLLAVDKCRLSSSLYSDSHVSLFL